MNLSSVINKPGNTEMRQFKKLLMLDLSIKMPFMLWGKNNKSLPLYIFSLMQLYDEKNTYN